MSETKDVDRILAGLGCWRGVRLGQLRELIHKAVAHVVEDVKWKKPSNPLGVPVWSSDGMICTGEAYNDKVKLTFTDEACVPDPKGLFHANFGDKIRPAIDLSKQDKS